MQGSCTEAAKPAACCLGHITTQESVQCKPEGCGITNMEACSQPAKQVLITATCQTALAFRLQGISTQGTYPEAAQKALIFAVVVALPVSVSLGLLGLGHLPLGILW